MSKMKYEIYKVGGHPYYDAILVYHSSYENRGIAEQELSQLQQKHPDYEFEIEVIDD